MANNASRFSSRVDNYIRFRPDYPPTIYDHLKNNSGFKSVDVIADIGSGTGKLAALFLKRDHVVYGIEPNNEMRQAAQVLLGENPQFHNRDGSAEKTGLLDNCIDMIIVGQAFHWFDPQKSKMEFQRVLRPNGLVVLVWNSRSRSQSPFMQGYEKLLLKYAEDYSKVQEANSDASVVETFFAPYQLHTYSLPNFQDFDFEGLKGRFLSSSYTPLPSSLAYSPAIGALEDLFEQHQVKGFVRFEYGTRLYWGRWD